MIDRNLDPEWLELISSALEQGITPEEIASFLSSYIKTTQQ